MSSTQLTKLKVRALWRLWHLERMPLLPFSLIFVFISSFLAATSLPMEHRNPGGPAGLPPHLRPAMSLSPCHRKNVVDSRSPDFLPSVGYVLAFSVEASHRHRDLGKPEQEWQWTSPCSCHLPTLPCQVSIFSLSRNPFFLLLYSSVSEAQGCRLQPRGVGRLATPDSKNMSEEQGKGYRLAANREVPCSVGGSTGSKDLQPTGVLLQMPREWGQGSSS